jgi:C_GCAxxG_C_C family probable redox protein
MAGTAAPDPVEHARRLFLESRNLYGCAETVFAVLKTVYGLDHPDDTSAAMALNGGVGYGGGICGAISGGALAVGLLAGRRLGSHRQAKRVAREITAQVLDEFAAAHGAVDCRALIGIDLRAPGGHSAFLRSGIWQDRCMAQVEFVIGRLAPLADPAAWEQAVNRTGDTGDR